MTCYHTTTPDRADSILAEGLKPNSLPTWFCSPTPYVMLSSEPWWNLNGDDSVVMEVRDPRIKAEYFDDPAGLRWPYDIGPEYLRQLSQAEAR